MNTKKTFIAKPSKGYGGIGIQLVQKLSDLIFFENNNDFVVSEYIPKPLLIENKKFDMRLYVLLKGIDPVQIYLCEEGMARFCTAAYEAPSATNIQNLYQHLTNFTLNKDS